MGEDGKLTAQHQYVARDAASFSLNYFNQDYQAINSQVNSFPAYQAGLPTSFPL